MVAPLFPPACRLPPFSHGPKNGAEWSLQGQTRNTVRKKYRGLVIDPEDDDDRNKRFPFIYTFGDVDGKKKHFPFIYAFRDVGGINKHFPFIYAFGGCCDKNTVQMACIINVSTIANVDDQCKYLATITHCAILLNRESIWAKSIALILKY